LVPRIILSRPAAPLRYSTAGFGPSSYFLWASSASELLEHGHRSLRTLYSSRQCFQRFGCNFLGQQCLRNIRVQALVPRISFFEPTEPLHNLGIGARTPESYLSIAEVQSNLFWAINAPHSTCPNLGDNIPVRMPYVKYEGKSTVCNIRWPGIHTKHALS
jgi:hypothetical protein